MDHILMVSRVFEDLAMGTTRSSTLVRELAGSTESVAVALTAIIDFWHGDFGSATEHADHALAAADSEEERGLALAAQVLAGAGDPVWVGTDPITEALAILARHTTDDSWWAAVRYLVAEGSLDSARLDDAAAALASGPAPHEVWRGHRFALAMGACAVRVSAFSGDISSARQQIAALTDQPGSDVMHDVLDALNCLLLGNANDASAVAVLTRNPRDTGPPDDLIRRGRSLLQAYGAIALGDSAAAAALVLAAGGDECLRQCNVIDRVLGLELLAVAALDQGDVESAVTWALGGEDLADHPIARPTLDRLAARIALAQGDIPSAIQLAERSLIGCRETRRQVEAAESEIVLAQCHIAANEVATAGRLLRVAVQAGDQTGHHAVRRAASRTLGAARRRLPPVAGGGWTVLSASETFVAERILAGAETDAIAAELVISPHTVRVHTSRVLCAFGVASRIGLLASVSAQGEAADKKLSHVLSPLTTRQQDVAKLVAAGTSNRRIAEDLGVSVRTVEKHVADIGQRWNAPARFGIAQLWHQSEYA